MSARGGALHATGMIVVGLLILFGKMASHSGGLVRGAVHEAPLAVRFAEHGAEGVGSNLVRNGENMFSGSGDADRSWGRNAAGNAGSGADATGPLHAYSFDERPHPVSGDLVGVGANDMYSPAGVRKRKRATYDVFVVAPTDRADAERIFESSTDPAYADRAVADAKEAMAKLATAKMRNSASNMLDAIEQSNEEYISIIGHNQGGKIIFPDDTVLDLGYLSEFCAKKNKFCIMLSCKSKIVGSRKSAGLHVRLTYQDAALISNQIKALMHKSRHGFISPAKVESGIHALLLSADTTILAADAVKVTYIPAAAFGIGAMLVSVDPD